MVTFQTGDLGIDKACSWILLEDEFTNRTWHPLAGSIQVPTLYRWPANQRQHVSLISLTALVYVNFDEV